ncbi:hypothetical protein ACFYWS_19865 [Streptomyces sp. NPDC002795]
MPLSINEEADRFLGMAVIPAEPPAGSANGGISYVCTACGHSWS